MSVDSVENRGQPLWGVVYRPSCMTDRSITAISMLIGHGVWAVRTPPVMGADHWRHGWQMGGRGSTAASSCRPTTRPACPSRASAQLSSATSASNSARMALTFQPPSSNGPYALAFLIAQVATRPSRSESAGSANFAVTLLDSRSQRPFGTRTRPVS